MPVQATPEYLYGDRLSPLPEDRRHVLKVDPVVGPSQLKAWKDENKRFIKQAVNNKIILDEYSLSDHQRRADLRPPQPGDPSWRGGITKEVRGDKCAIVCDTDGIVGVVIIPRFLKEISLCQVNANTIGFMTRELASTNGKPAGSTSNGKARGGIDTYKTETGISGTATYVLAWHQQAHEDTNSFEPSRSLTQSRSGLHSHLRGQFLSGTRNLHLRINHLIELMRPEFHQLLCSVRPHLREHPTICQLMALWESSFLGHSVIMNRTSGEHLDSNRIRRGWDGLLAAGNFSGSDIFFKDMNLTVQFQPGALVLFDRTAQRHAIMDWHGEQRISNAFFVHRSVFNELGIDTTLPDLTIQAIQDNIYPAVTNKCKRKGQGKGRFSKSKPSRSADRSCRS